jgi:micrococcal nuclease
MRYSKAWGTTYFPKFLLFGSSLLCIFLVSASCRSKTRYSANNDIISGKVIGITDGDTFTLLTEAKHQEKIRLYGIDCPEKKQAFGLVAKQKLSQIIFGKQVRVEFKTYDRWKRVVGVVFQDSENINEAMLQYGLAWHFKKYDNNAEWTSMEENARNKKVGLWVDPNPTPPWQSRKTK